MEYLTKEGKNNIIKIAKKMKSNGIIAKISLSKINEIFGGDTWE